MIDGSVIESRDLGNYDGFDIVMYMVKNPYQISEHKKAFWVTVYFVAIRADQQLGMYTINNVLHKPDSKKKHAFKRVNKKVGIICAINDANMLLDLLHDEDLTNDEEPC